jgi:hypothetical protein
MPLEILLQVLGWSTVINIAVLCFSTLALIIAKHPVTALQAKLFGITPEQCRWAAYRYLATYKILVLVFNLAPYLALRIALAS